MSRPRPNPAAGKPKFESFAIQVEPSPSRGVLETVRKVVKEELGDGWEILPIHEPSGEFDVSRASGLRTARAWNLTHRLRKRPEVVYAEPLFRVSTVEQHETPPPARRRARSGSDEDDPATEGKFDWSLDQLAVKEAWDLFGSEAPGDGIVIGHPDTGFTNHPEIADPIRLLRGYDFEDEDGDATDPLSGGLLRHPGHGTATSSVIFSGAGPPQSGSAGAFVSGIAPAASLIPIRTTKSVILWSMRNLTRAIRYATQVDTHVISISLGGPVPTQALHNAVKDAEGAGIIVLAAAGNQVRFVVWPAVYDEVIAVAASTVARTPWDGSCRGPAVDVAAPGASVWRARSKKKSGNVQFSVERGSGTSFAVAATAGVAALWLSFHGREFLIQRYGRHRVPAVFKQLLEKTCLPPEGWNDEKYGKGIVNAVGLLNEPLPEVAPAIGMRGVSRRGVSEDETGIETLVHMLGAAPRSSVVRTLAELLRVPEDELPRTLRDVGDELTFQLGTDPRLRKQLEGAAQRPTLRARRGRAVRPDRLSPVRRRIAGRGASRRLESVLRGSA